jgi:hypothetical protein
MTVQRFVLAFGGTLAFTGTALGFFVHPAFLIAPAFVGLNLLQSAFTGFCPLALILRASGVPDAAGPAWTRAGCAIAPRTSAPALR